LNSSFYILRLFLLGGLAWGMVASARNLHGVQSDGKRVHAAGGFERSESILDLVRETHGETSDSGRSKRRYEAVSEDEETAEDYEDDSYYDDEVDEYEDSDDEAYSEKMDTFNPALDSPRVLGPAMRWDDPQFLQAAANNQNFIGGASPGGDIQISDGSKNDTCILVHGIPDRAMDMFRGTFNMYGAMFQNVNGIDSMIAAVENCANAMGGWVPNLVISTHGFSKGYTQIGLQTNGQGLAKFIGAMTTKNIGIGRIRFLSCLVAQGVDQDQQQHMMKQLALGVPGPPRKPGDTTIPPGPEVSAWDQVIWAGIGSIFSRGNKWSISARNLNPDREIELARNGSGNDDRSYSENPDSMPRMDWAQQQNGGYSQEQQWNNSNGLMQPQFNQQYSAASWHPGGREIASAAPVWPSRTRGVYPNLGLH
jgi:hypothetical protein